MKRFTIALFVLVCLCLFASTSEAGCRKHRVGHAAQALIHRNGRCG